MKAVLSYWITRPLLEEQKYVQLYAVTKKQRGANPEFMWFKSTWNDEHLESTHRVSRHIVQSDIYYDQQWILENVK